MESSISCAQTSHQKKLKIKHEGTKASESSDDKNSTASNTLKELKNSEQRTRVPFTFEEDSYIRKGIKHGFGHWMEILRSFKDNFRGSHTADSIKERAEKLFDKQK